MTPGKLPDHLPPSLDVIKQLGFPLDLEQIKARSRVIDWERLAATVEKGITVDVGPLDPKLLRERLISCSHTDRPALLASAVRKLFEAAPDSAPAAARAYVSSQLQQALDGFNIINTNAGDFRSGDLPPHFNSFSDLVIDGALAECIARKVLPKTQEAR
jgi:hypothetical protein